MNRTISLAHLPVVQNYVRKMEPNSSIFPKKSKWVLAVSFCIKFLYIYLHLAFFEKSKLILLVSLLRFIYREPVCGFLITLEN